MKKLKIRTQFNYELSVGERNSTPSKTIPDQTLSIPELIKRYASGRPLEGKRTPFYDEDPEKDLLGGRPFASFDLSEQHQILENAKNEYQETIDRLRNNKNKTFGESADKADETNVSKSGEA